MVVCRHKTTQTIQMYEIKQNQYVVHAYTNKIAIFQFAILKSDTSKHRMQAQTNKIRFVKTQREGNEILIDCNTHTPTLRQHTHILLDRSTQTHTHKHLCSILNYNVIVSCQLNLSCSATSLPHISVCLQSSTEIHVDSQQPGKRTLWTSHIKPKCGRVI